MTYFKEIDLKKVNRSKNESVNYMAPNNFELVIDRLTFPNVAFSVVQLSIPGFDINSTDTAFATRNVPLHADKVSYQNFDMTFLVDEDMKNYEELHDWMLAQVIQKDDYSNDHKRRDIKIIINSSHNNMVKTITLHGAFPTNLGPISLDTQITTVGYATCNAVFAYAYFTIS